MLIGNGRLNMVRHWLLHGSRRLLRELLIRGNQRRFNVLVGGL